MHRRFYSENRIDSDGVEIRGAEHQHLTKVMRLDVGDLVTLFDGSGCEFQATITNVQRHCTQLRIESQEAVSRELSFELTVGVALPKGDRQQWLVEKCVEIGVTRMIPLETARGVAQPQPKSLDRLTRWIVAASKQSRRNLLMQVTSPETLREFASRANEQPVLVAHPNASERFGQVGMTTCRQADRITVAIGPEGGFSGEELDQATAAGCQIVSLGKRILRIETATVALVSAITLWRDD